MKEISSELTPGVDFIGVFDPFIRTFDIIMKTANGTTYNSYIIRGSEGVMIIDTVKKEFEDEFFEKLEAKCSYDEIKYIVLLHMEPDHSGALPELAKRAPNATLLTSPPAAKMTKELHPHSLTIEKMKTGKSVSLGDKTIEFLSTPFLHWPETMSCYLVEDKILFSCDVFGSHYCDKRLYNTKVGDFRYAFKYYYDHIMRPFKSYVIKALDLYEKLDIDIIAPSHGPVLVTYIDRYLKRYRDWSTEINYKKREVEDKIVSIFYVTSYGNTYEMATAINEGLHSVSNIRSNMYDITALEEQNMVNLLEESDGILVGTPTINADAPKPTWDLLASMAFVQTIGRMGATFGSYGWSGEAPSMLQERMKGLKMKTPLEPLSFKLIPNKDELKECYEYGQKFAKEIIERF